MSVSSILKLLETYLKQHNVQYTSINESSTSALWQSNETSVSVTAIGQHQFLISIVSGSRVCSALYVPGKEDGYEKFEAFFSSQLSEGISMLLPNSESDSSTKGPEKNSENQDKALASEQNKGKTSSLQNPPSAVFQPRDQEWTRPSDMPEFDDEYELKARNNRTSVPPFSIGEGDLNPAGSGPYPHLKPYIDPLAAPGSGMMPDQSHPIFGQSRENTSRRGVPPGARFDDPYGDDNLDDMGMGLPGNLRQPQGPSFGGPNLGGFGNSPFGPRFG